MKKYCISEIGKITTIVDYIHDRGFDIDKISFDKKTNRLEFLTTVVDPEEYTEKRFLFLRKKTCKVFEAKLIFFNVVSYEIVDDAQVGKGDFNEILLEGDSVVVTCGLPVYIRIKISKLYIELIITNKIVGYKNYFDVSIKKRRSTKKGSGLNI
jgi:hypothetical protein